MSNLIYRSEIINIATSRGAATSTVNSSIVDTAGYDSATFIGRFATAHATTEGAQVMQATATGASFAAANGAVARAVTDYRIEVTKPRKRYLRVRTSRQSGALGDQWVILSNSRVHSSSTRSFTYANSPT